ncbi:MAG: hypothetical protein BGO31_12885 [Bacteroidetes bacterium 43-16]|nr:MAG: hypothetical protein BGO31_12885 [Bacteroidetes bacterium 43-16]
MEKVAFSPAGFKQLETQLYTLDDTALLVEANAVLSDYVDWASNHIILSLDQVAYLEGLDPLFISSLANNASIAFRNRLPLNLILPENYSVAEKDKRGKWFLDASTIAASNIPGSSIQATGELIYEFEIEA